MMKTILIQGAMYGEIKYLVDFWNCEKTEINGYSFYKCAYNGINIIISLTKIGIIHSTIATMIGINEFKPDVIINQGTAGGHTRNIKVGDIIIGEKAVYLNNPRTPVKGFGEGSNALEWIPGNSGTFLINANTKLVNIAKNTEYDGTLLCGKLGSGDIYSREVDRIDLLHSQLGELSEDMETISVYKVCETFMVPVLGVRIISNNEITGNADVEEQFEFAQKTLQKYIIRLTQNISKDFFA